MEIRPYLNELVRVLEKSRTDALPDDCRALILATLDAESKAGVHLTQTIHEMKHLTQVLTQWGRHATAKAIVDLVKGHPAVKAEIGRTSLEAQHKRQEERMGEYTAKLGALAPGALADPNAPTISLKELLQAQLKRGG